MRYSLPARIQWRSHGGGGLGGTRPPTCPKDRLWDSSRSDEKLVRLVGGYHFKMSASEYLRCAPKYTISRLNNQNSAPYPPRHLRRLASRAFGARPPPLKNPGYAPARVGLLPAAGTVLHGVTLLVCVSVRPDYGHKIRSSPPSEWTRITLTSIIRGRVRLLCHALRIFFCYRSTGS